MGLERKTCRDFNWPAVAPGRSVSGACSISSRCSQRQYRSRDNRNMVLTMPTLLDTCSTWGMVITP